ncbi:MAG TPA: ABC transporter ATP-binding protein [Nitrospirota bacterium]|nr:ABC transporter ATP-binding protein [Nitrospirota bacterium]
MIELKRLTKTYTVSGQTIHAVRPVDLLIEAGQFVSIVGHSGSGKSTLLSLIGGIARPDAGSVFVDGADIWSYTDAMLSKLRNEKYGFIYQFASLIPTLTARENVMLPAAFGKSEAPADARELLAAVGLGDKVNRYPSELSGGEQQRVAIARAFIHSPHIILADEPTGDLDEETEAEIMSFFERINRERNITLIMVTHSSEIALRAPHRFRMKQGSLERLA